MNGTLEFRPSSWCEGVGYSDSDRIVIYDDARVTLPIPFPVDFVSAIPTADPSGPAFHVHFAASIGELDGDPRSIVYIDGI